MAGLWSIGRTVPVRFRFGSMAEAMEIVGSDLFKIEGSGDGIVFLSPFGIESGSGVNLMAIARTVGHAKGLAQHATQKLTGPAV